MKSKRILPIALGGGIGGPVLIFLVIIIFSPNLFMRGIIMKNLEKSFGGKATAEEASFSWREGVVISGLFIQEEKGQRPILKVDSIHLKFALFPLLKYRVVIQSLEVNRPEMVIYRGSRKGPSLDGAPELASAAGEKTASGKPLTGGYTFPHIIEAKINEGTFIFTDLDSGESTKVENFNATLTGLKPGGTAKIDGECDIVGGGGTDHASISGTVEGFEMIKLEALRGKLVFKSGFADVRAAVDMSRLNTPDAKVLNATVKGDFQKAVTRLGAILPLPEDVIIKGSVDTEIDATARPGGTMLLEGQTSTTNLYLRVPPHLKYPFRSSRATLFHRVEIDPREGLANVEKLVLHTEYMTLESSGTLHRDGGVKAALHLTAPLEELTLRLAPAYAPLGQVIAVGDISSDVEVQGTFGKKIALKGSSRIDGLDLETKSFKYADREVTLKHDLDYDTEAAAVYVRSAEFSSRLLVLNLKEGQVQFGPGGYHQGKLSLICNLEELPRWYTLPPSLKLKGTGNINLDLKGPMAGPIYKGITAGGSLGVDEILYEDYRITEVATQSLTLDDNLLNAALDMKVNDTPATATLRVDLAPDRAGGPYIENAEFHASDVPAAYTMKNGKFNGIVSVDVNKAAGEGISWNETLRKTLTASGNVKIKEGRLSAPDMLSPIFMLLGHPGSEYIIDSLTSDFRIQDERIYSNRSEIKGKPFDMELSGWTGFDNRLDYDATVFIPKEMIGRDVQRIFGPMVKGDYAAIPIKISGQLPGPHVQIRSNAVLEGILNSVFKGPQRQTPAQSGGGTSAPGAGETTGQPKGPEALFETIFKGLPKTRTPAETPEQPTGTPEAPAPAPKQPEGQQPAEQPQEPAGVPEETEEKFKELEKVFKDIFK